MTKKNKSKFNLDNYKTHDGERGSTEKWREAIRQALLENPEMTKEEIEKKLTKLGIRKISTE